MINPGMVNIMIRGMNKVRLAGTLVQLSIGYYIRIQDIMSRIARFAIRNILNYAPIYAARYTDLGTYYLGTYHSLGLMCSVFITL